MWENINPNAIASVRKAADLLFEWDTAQGMDGPTKAHQSNITDEDPIVRWAKLNAGGMKCNVNTTYLVKKASMG